MAILKTASVRVSSIQIMQVRVQNKGKSLWKSRYDSDVSQNIIIINLNALEKRQKIVTMIFGPKFSRLHVKRVGQPGSKTR